MGRETRDVIGDQEAVRLRQCLIVSRLGSSRVYRLTSPELILTARLESAPYQPNPGAAGIRALPVGREAFLASCYRK